MKPLIASTIGLITFFTVAANAARPVTEITVARARMTETTRVTPSVTLFTLALKQKKGAAEPTSLQFTESQPVFCVTAPCPPLVLSKKTFAIEAIEERSCHDTVYVARELINGRVTRSSAYLELTDHRTSVCDMHYENMWEMEVSSLKTGKRTFVGNPR